MKKQCGFLLLYVVVAVLLLPLLLTQTACLPKQTKDV